MPERLYIFKNISRDSLRTFFTFFYPDRTHYRFYTKTMIEIEDFNNPFNIDLWWLLDRNSHEKVGEISYYQMPVGFHMQFLYDESDAIPIFISEIIKNAQAIGVIIEPLSSELLISSKNKIDSNSISQPSKAGKRGRKSYTDEEKLDALLEWDKTDHSRVYLEEFLKKKFGSNNNYPLVMPTTFHGWRQRLREKGLYPE